METIIFYHSILILSTLFVYLSEKGKGKLEYYLFKLTAFIIVFIPSAIRFNVGTDFPEYLRMFLYPSGYTYIEPAFYQLILLLRIFTEDPQWLFFVSSFLFTFFIFKSYPKKNAWVFHLALFLLLWFPSLNIIRQSISLAICLIAILSFIDKKYTQFILLTLLASLFHYSSFIQLLLGAIAMVPLSHKAKAKTTPIVSIFIITCTLFLMDYVVSLSSLIVDLIGLDKYLKYLDINTHSTTDNSLNIGITIKVLFAIYLLSNTKNFLKNNSQHWILIVFTIFYAFASILATKLHYMDRIQYLFSLGPTMLIYISLQLPANKALNRVIITAFILFQIITFSLKTFPPQYNEISDVHPYTTFMSK